MEERLWQYIDGVCNEAEKAEIKILLQTRPDWKEKYNELLQVHQMINLTELEEPSLRFTQNVMEEISKLHIAPATKTYINKRVIQGIGGFFITMIVGLLIYCLAGINWTESDSGINLPVDLSKVEWSGFFNNTYTQIFMMVNVVLALMLLDNYLTKRKEQIKQVKH